MALFHFTDVGTFNKKIKVSRQQTWGDVVYCQDQGYCYHVTVGPGIGWNEVAFVSTLPKSPEVEKLLQQLGAHPITF